MSLDDQLDALGFPPAEVRVGGPVVGSVVPWGVGEWAVSWREAGSCMTAATFHASEAEANAAVAKYAPGAPPGLLWLPVP